MGRPAYISGMLMTLMVVGVIATLIMNPCGRDFAAQDAVRASISAEPTCLLHGWVNDSITHEGISEATVGYFSSEPFWVEVTLTNETGYYELLANRSNLLVLCDKNGYLSTMVMIDTTGESEYRLDFELEAEPTIPTASMTIDPSANVSAHNPLSASMVVEDFNLQIVEVLVGGIFNRTGDCINFTMAAVGVTMPSFGYSYGDMYFDYTYENDVFEGSVEWSAKTSRSGYVGNETSKDYLQASIISTTLDRVSYGFPAYYSSDTLSMEEGYAWFDNDTGAYEGFTFLEPSIPIPPPVDLKGEIAPAVGVFPWEFNSTMTFREMAFLNSSIAVLDQRSVVGLTFEYSDVAPSGEYFAMLLAIDEAFNVNGTLELFTVDTDPPVADAGADCTIEIGDEVVLAGSGSDNVGVDNYTWIIEDDGTEVTLFGKTVSYEFLEPGVHTVTLVVRDGGYNEGSDIVVVMVEADEIPVAEAGPAALTVPEDIPVTFDGDNSYDDGEVVGYSWEIVELDEHSTESVFTFTFEQPGTYKVELIVTDDAGQSSEPDTVVVTVTDETDPTADAGEDLEVLIGQEFRLNASGSSDNVDIVNYSWSCDEIDDWEADVAEVDVTVDSEGVYTFTLEVTDAAGNSDTDTVVVHVSDPNEAPIANAGEDIEAQAGDTVQLNASQSSDDNGVENWTWSFEYDGEMVELYGESVEFTFDIEGTYVINLTVTDAQGLTGHDDVEVVITEPATSSQFLLYAGVSLAILAGAIAVAFTLLRRGKPGE